MVIGSSELFSQARTELAARSYSIMSWLAPGTKAGSGVGPS